MEPSLSYDHLRRLTDETGILEHAEGMVPRREHGYCTDDNARALIVALGAGDTSSAWDVAHLADVYLGFIRDAHRGGGRFAARMDYSRRWDPMAESDDASGRAIMALGISAARHPVPALRESSLALFNASSSFVSVHPRAMAYAGIGAAEVLAGASSNHAAARLAGRALELLHVPPISTEWAWPYERLTYDNAVITEALMACGAALGEVSARDAGLERLGWLVELQTATDGHLSIVPAGGLVAGEPRPAFDQQPIEVCGLARAARRAFMLTHDDAWITVIDRCVRWFGGANDAHTAMFDPATGAGYDGLTRTGRNENCGAESTLAALHTMQIARRCGVSRTFTPAIPPRHRTNPFD